MKLIYKFANICVLISLLFSGIAFAANEPETAKDTTAKDTTAAQEQASAPVVDPIQMLTGVTNNVLAALKQNHITKDSKPKELYAVVDKYILPYVDFNEMSIWVAGRSAWGKASQAAREDFVKQFKILVVRTYATALNSYSDEKVEFIQQKIDTNKNRIQVSSYIKRANKEKIRLDYRLIKHGNSWLVYDVIIEGVSILQGFQAQFSDQIRKDGLAKVMEQIKQHNIKKET